MYDLKISACDLIPVIKTLTSDNISRFVSIAAHTHAMGWLHKLKESLYKCKMCNNTPPRNEETSFNKWDTIIKSYALCILKSVLYGSSGSTLLVLSRWSCNTCMYLVPLHGAYMYVASLMYKAFRKTCYRLQ